MTESTQEQDLKQLRGMWEPRSTEELRDVWNQNDRQAWRDEVFDVIGQILSTRLGSVPPQGEPAVHTPPKTSRRAKWVVLALALIIIPITAYLLINRVNSTEQVRRDVTQTITLTRSSNPKRLVYENDIVQISIGYDQFLEYIESQLNDPKSDTIMRESYREQQAKVDLELSQSDVLTLTEPHTEELIASLLMAGKGAVLDKRSQSYVNTIKWQDYVMTCGPLCGSGIYSFYLPDANLFNPRGTRFLEVQYLWF